ncbi:MAG: hypothetical protein AB7K64_16880 [Variibacter sp.]
MAAGSARGSKGNLARSKSEAAENRNWFAGHQQKYNENAFDAFAKWVQGKSITPIEPLPVIDVPFGNSGLTVRLRPDVSFDLNGVRYSMALWATTKPPLSVETLSVALLFLTAAYKIKGYNDRAHLILDTVGNRLFREADILSKAIFILKDRVDAFKRSA